MTCFVFLQIYYHFVYKHTENICVYYQKSLIQLLSSETWIIIKRVERVIKSSIKNICYFDFRLKFMLSLTQLVYCIKLFLQYNKTNRFLTYFDDIPANEEEFPWHFQPLGRSKKSSDSHTLAKTCDDSCVFIRLQIPDHFVESLVFTSTGGWLCVGDAYPHVLC